jgi:hypothetical protein
VENEFHRVVRNKIAYKSLGGKPEGKITLGKLENK